MSIAQDLNKGNAMIKELEKEGKAVRADKVVDTKNKLIKGLSKCNSCTINDHCVYYKAGNACQLELEIRKNVWKKFNGMTSLNAEDMFKEIVSNYCKLEMMISQLPTPKGIMALIYLQMSMFKLRFGERHVVANIEQSSNTSMDITALMNKYSQLSSNNDATKDIEEVDAELAGFDKPENIKQLMEESKDEENSKTNTNS